MSDKSASGELDVHTELLAGTPFGELGAGQVAEVARLFVRRHVVKGAVVFLEGEAGDRFFVVVDGKLKAFRHAPPARDVTVFTLGQGDFFGFLPLLDGGPYPVSVSALTAAQLLVLHRPDFQRFTHANPRFCLALVEHLGRRLRGCLGQVEMLGRQGAVARTAHGLLSLVPGATIRAGRVEATLPSSQAEFAQVLHITPENLSRALAKLTRDGVIERLSRRRFAVLSVSGLQRAADGRAQL